jgi:arylsulfatase A-like enzyme
VLLTVDTLRADHLSSYGYPRPTSPHIDALAGAGVRFAQATATRGQTWPSLVSLMTSTLPAVHGVLANGYVFKGQIPTLAETVRACGYETAAFLTNMLTTPHPGFELVNTYQQGNGDVEATRDAIAWLGEKREKPFFLWLHWIGPHAPYAPSPANLAPFRDGYRGDLDAELSTLRRIQTERRVLTDAELAHIVSLYDGEIAQVDARIGEVLAALQQTGRSENAFVVLSADHGEELYDRNFFIGHQMSVYSSVLRVPLILRGPGVPAGKVVEEAVSLMDVAPTLLALLGIDAPPSFEGRPLLKRGELLPAPDFALAQLEPRQVYSIRTKRWHYIWFPRFAEQTDIEKRDYPIAAEELYDLQSDPGERQNVIASHPGVAAQLHKRLAEKMPSRVEASAPELTPEARAELKALGYID